MAIDCLILGPAYPYRGGISDTNHAFAEELINQNIRVEIWTFTKLYPNLLFPGKTQFESLEKEYTYPIHRKIHAYHPLKWKAVAKEINELNPQRVVFRYWTPFLALAWGTIAKNVKPEINKIALIDNWKPHEPKPWDKTLNQYFSSKIHQITTLSEAVYSEIIKEVKLPVGKGFHPISDNLPKAVSKEEARRRLKLYPNTPYVLFFGLIRSYKGLDHLINAFSIEPLASSTTELLVVGEFYEKIESYEEQIKKLGLESRIRIVNEFVPFEVARDYFCAADLVAQPYKTATQSGVTPLAYHYETPLVVTDIEGLQTPILKDKTGKVCSKTPKSLASVIHNLLSSEDLLKIKKNLQRAKGKYSWKTFVEQWIRFTED